MELTVKERITLRRVLPERGNDITFRAVLELRDMLPLTEEEIEALGIHEATPDELKALGITAEAQMMVWNSNADVPREFTFTKTQRSVIDKALADLNNNGALDDETYPLWLKFVGE